MGKGLRRIVRDDFNSKEVSKSRNFNKIRKYFDMSDNDEYTIDDQTWDDLNMDRVFEKFDRTYSSPGESALYSMLRNPLMDEEPLKKRSESIEMFKTNPEIRDRLMEIFFNLGRDRKNSFLDMIETDLVVNKAKYVLYTFIGKILPFIIVLLGIFVDTRVLIGMVVLSFLTVNINARERSTIKSKGILYLTNLIKFAKKLANIRHESIKDYTVKIEEILKQIVGIDRGTQFIGFANMWDGLLEAFSVIFLLEESAYYAISDKIQKDREALMELYYKVGEIEALLSISGYQNNLEEQYINPRFVEGLSLSVSDGVHPLIENPVPNSITMQSKGIVLTGTNMSGKSTFLRMLGINILLAQTFYFVLASEYEAPFYNVVSSISPNDDLVKGKSFYIAEVESLLRIINALEKEIPVFCPIDEIFRGTNPVERIAMSAEILSYLNSKKALTIVATHDRELADILKDNYEFYHFTEEVGSKEGLSFDYKLKKGVTQTRNAIRLLEYMEFPKVIVDKAYKRAETIEGYI